MIHHPVLAAIGLILIVLLSYLEIRYYRAGFPRSRNWLVTLFLCGAGASISVSLALISDPLLMFQSVGTCGGMLFITIGGGIVGVYTAPKYAKEAEKNRERLRGR